MCLRVPISEDWSTLEKFQRTRGILKIMANAIYAMWRGQSNAPLIMLALLPLSEERSGPPSWNHWTVPTARSFRPRLTASWRCRLVYEKLRANSVIVDELGPDTLMAELRKVWSKRVTIPRAFCARSSRAVWAPWLTRFALRAKRGRRLPPPVTAAAP